MGLYYGVLTLGSQNEIKNKQVVLDLPSNLAPPVSLASCPASTRFEPPQGTDRSKHALCPSPSSKPQRRHLWDALKYAIHLSQVELWIHTACKLQSRSGGSTISKPANRSSIELGKLWRR